MVDASAKQTLCYRIFHALWNTNDATVEQLQREVKATSSQLQSYLRHFKEVMGGELVNFRNPPGTRKYMWSMKANGRTCKDMFEIFLDKKTALMDSKSKNKKVDKKDPKEITAETGEPEVIQPVLMEAKPLIPDNLKITFDGKVDINITLSIKLG